MKFFAIKFGFFSLLINVISAYGMLIDIGRYSSGELVETELVFKNKAKDHSNCKTMLPFKYHSEISKHVNYVPEGCAIELAYNIPSRQVAIAGPASPCHIIAISNAHDKDIGDAHKKTIIIHSYFNTNIQKHCQNIVNKKLFVESSSKAIQVLLYSVVMPEAEYYQKDMCDEGETLSWSEQHNNMSQKEYMLYCADIISKALTISLKNVTTKLFNRSNDEAAAIAAGCLYFDIQQATPENPWGARNICIKDFGLEESVHSKLKFIMGTGSITSEGLPTEHFYRWLSEGYHQFNKPATTMHSMPVALVETENCGLCVDCITKNAVVQ